MTGDPPGAADAPDPASFVGRTWSGDPVTVARHEAFLWAAATRDPEDRFRYAREGVQYAPPTFAQVIARRAAGTGDVEGELRGPEPADPSAPTVFLGGNRLAVHRPPAVGRTYRATAEAADCERKSGSGGPFDLLTVEYRVEDGEGRAFDLASDFVVVPGDADGPGGGGPERTNAPRDDAGGPPGERLPEGGVDPGALQPGTVAARRVVPDLSPADMRTVAAVVDDPNPIHFDPEAAAGEGHPGRVNQGPANAAYAGQAALSVAGSPTDLQSLAVRYEGFAHEGETVVATATVEGVGDRSVDDVGGRPVELRLAATAGGRTVVTGSATVLAGGDAEN